MPPHNLLATVTLEASNNVAKDHAVNTFAIGRDGGAYSAAEQTAIADALAAFYNTVQPVGNSVAHFIGPSRKRTAGGLVVRLYDISGKEQRTRGVDAKGRPAWKQPVIGSPISTFGRTLGPIGILPDALPAEVAVCMSLRTELRDTVQTEVANEDADTAPDRPKARNTGRIYVGPLNRLALGQEVEGERRVEANMRTALTTAANQLHDELKANAATFWCIWSRADGTLREVHDVVVDNAFDTIRKRGFRATSSTSLVVMP